jgi:hypothetical protein
MARISGKLKQNTFQTTVAADHPRGDPCGAAPLFLPGCFEQRCLHLHTMPAMLLGPQHVGRAVVDQGRGACGLDHFSQPGRIFRGLLR